MKSRASLSPAYRWQIASRSVAAIGGGYALGALSTMSLAIYLPTPRAESVLIATMVSFLIYLCVAIWSFAARTPVRAWLGIILPSAVIALLLMAQGVRT